MPQSPPFFRVRRPRDSVVLHQTGSVRALLRDFRFYLSVTDILLPCNRPDSGVFCTFKNVTDCGSLMFCGQVSDLDLRYRVHKNVIIMSGLSYYHYDVFDDIEFNFGELLV